MEEETFEAFDAEDAVIIEGHNWMNEYNRHLGPGQAANTNFLREAIQQQGDNDPRLTDVFARKYSAHLQSQHMMRMIHLIERLTQNEPPMSVEQKARWMRQAEEEDTHYRGMIERHHMQYGGSTHERYNEMRDEFDAYIDDEDDKSVLDKNRDERDFTII